MALRRHRGHSFFYSYVSSTKRIKLEWEHCMRQLLKADLAEQTRNCTSHLISPIRTELIHFSNASNSLSFKKGSALLYTAAEKFRNRFGKCLGHICDSSFLRCRQIISRCRNIAASAEKMLVLQAGRKPLLGALESCLALRAVQIARSLLWQGLQSRTG